VSRYHKGKTNLDFTEARDSEWQWHQLGHMQIRTSPQTDNHASTPPLSFFTDRMPYLPPNQQRQSTEGNVMYRLAQKNKTRDYFESKAAEIVEVVQQQLRRLVKCLNDDLITDAPLLLAVKEF